MRSLFAAAIFALCALLNAPPAVADVGDQRAAVVSTVVTTARHAPAHHHHAERYRHHHRTRRAASATSLPRVIEKAVTATGRAIADAGHAAAEAGTKIANVLTLGNTSGMNGAFVSKLAAMNAEMPAGSACRVFSGFRTHEHQARLYRQNHRPGFVARPGHSQHELGLAADLACRGNGLRFAHAHARQFGMYFPMSYEPWHIQPGNGATMLARHGGSHVARFARAHSHPRHASRHHRNRRYARA
jgi:hypothetical protein